MPITELLTAFFVTSLMVFAVWLALEVRLKVQHYRWRQRVRREHREFMQHLRAGNWEWVMNRLDEGAKK